MEEDQEMMKHVCKFCRKNFPSGRSLGGHMRSHDHDDDDYDHDDDGDEFVVAVRRRMKKKEGYGLRENPKKTWRVLTDSTNEQEIQDPFDVVLDKLCKECGKGFQSMKALFGHMKCHKKNKSFELDEEEEEDDEDSNATVLPKRKIRSKRKLRTRYKKSNNTSSSVVNFGDNSLDSIAESSDNNDEKEQEEVAMSLIMLSRDVRPWFGINSIAEFSDNNDDDSLELEAPLTHLVSKIEGKKFITNSSEIVKMNKKPKKLDFGNVVCSDVKSKGKSLEVFDNESEGNDDGLKMKKATRVSVVENGKDEKKKMEIELDSELAFEVNVVDSETKVTSEGEFRKRKYQKRGKFECATCNKTFQSYQALGGHRASHKRTKGFSASRNDQSSENGNSTELEVDVEMNVNAEGRMVESERVAGMRDYLDLDLNLPAASIDDERNGHAEIYKPWWLVGSSIKQEAMIGLLSN